MYINHAKGLFNPSAPAFSYWVWCNDQILGCLIGLMTYAVQKSPISLSLAEPNWMGWFSCKIHIISYCCMNPTACFRLIHKLCEAIDADRLIVIFWAGTSGMVMSSHKRESTVLLGSTTTVWRDQALWRLTLTALILSSNHRVVETFDSFRSYNDNYPSCYCILCLLCFVKVDWKIDNLIHLRFLKSFHVTALSGIMNMCF